MQRVRTRGRAGAGAGAGGGSGSSSGDAGAEAGTRMPEGFKMPEGLQMPGGAELPEGLRDIFADGGMKLVGADGVERTFGDLDALAEEARRQKAEAEAREAAKDEL